MIQKESIDQEVFDPWQDIGELVESQCQEKGGAKSHVLSQLVPRLAHPGECIPGADEIPNGNRL